MATTAPQSNATDIITYFNSKNGSSLWAKQPAVSCEVKPDDKLGSSLFAWDTKNHTVSWNDVQCKLPEGSHWDSFEVSFPKETHVFTDANHHDVLTISRQLAEHSHAAEGLAALVLILGTLGVGALGGLGLGAFCQAVMSKPKSSPYPYYA